MEKKYRISIKIGDSSFEVESSDLDWLEKKEKEYLQLIQGTSVKHKVSPHKEIAQAVPSTLPPEMTLNEFYRKYLKKIKSRPSIAVFFLYYLIKIKKKDKIKTADVQRCFGDIGYPNWNKLNMTDVLTSAKRRALVNYINKLWTLTTTGEDYILNQISGKSK